MGASPGVADRRRELLRSVFGFEQFREGQEAAVAKLLGEMFERAEWRVDLCTDGASALERLSGEGRYDLLLFDKDLPGMSGLELVLRARSIPGRRRAKRPM